MVIDTANDQRLHFILAGDAAEIWPEACLHFGFDERAAFFGGPDAMHQATGEGVHGFGFVVI